LVRRLEVRKISSEIIVIQFLIGLLALINFSKIPESDLLNYYNYYSSVQPALGIRNFILPINWYGFEPFWVVLVMLGKSFGFTAKVFHLIIFYFSYSLIFQALQLIGGRSKGFYIFLSLYLFQPYLFSVSFHLFRQLFAVSMMVYLLARIEKNTNIILTLPVLIHSSSIIVAVSSIKFRIWHLILFFILGVSMFFLAPEISNLLVSKINPNTSHDLGLINIKEIVLYIISSILAIYVLTFETKKILRIISTSLIILLFFVIIFRSNSELIKRLVFHLYLLTPFLLISIHNKTGLNIAKIILPLMAIFFVYHFIFINPWKYGLY